MPVDTTKARVYKHLMELEEEDIQKQHHTEIRGMAMRLGFDSRRDVEENVEFLVGERRWIIQNFKEKNLRWREGGYDEIEARD